MEEGWIRVSSPFHAQAYLHRELTDESLDALAELMVQYADRDGHFLFDSWDLANGDWEDSPEPAPGAPQTIGDFVRSRLGRAGENAFFARLLVSP